MSLPRAPKIDPPSDEIDPPFELLTPHTIAAPFLFGSPHSGRIYPASFLQSSRLDPVALRRSEDFMTDELFAGVLDHGLPLLKANFPRAYLDVNREPYELDPRMFSGRLPAFANTRSMRVAGGLGTIARVVADAQEIYSGPLQVEDALTRVERLYMPYHRTLENTLNTLRGSYDFAVLVDCHSMPSTAADDNRPRPDIVLGDRYGTSCSALIANAAQTLLEKLGYTVRRNTPYAGGFITERYGLPARGLHTLQIEVNRGLYMDETAMKRSSGFAQLQRDMATFAGAFVAYVMAELQPHQAAAE